LEDFALLSPQIGEKKGKLKANIRGIKGNRQALPRFATPKKEGREEDSDRNRRKKKACASRGGGKWGSEGGKVARVHGDRTLNGFRTGTKNEEGVDY